MRSWRGWSWDDGNFGGSGLEPHLATFRRFRFGRSGTPRGAFRQSAGDKRGQHWPTRARALVAGFARLASAAPLLSAVHRGRGGRLLSFPLPVPIVGIGAARVCALLWQTKLFAEKLLHDLAL